MRGQLRLSFMTFGSALVCAVLISALSGCYFRNNTEEGVATGAVVGAGTGAVLGSTSGQTGAGAASGAAAGAVIGGITGGVVDATEKEKENKKKQDQLLDFQRREFNRQRREIEDLRRQQYQDEEFRRKYPDPSAEE